MSLITLTSMSSALHPSPVRPRPRKPSDDMTDATLLNSSSWPNQSPSRQLCSSPERSSSPPRTPYAAGQNCDFAYIRSSPCPATAPDVSYMREYYEQTSGFWPKFTVPHNHSQPQTYYSSPFVSRLAHPRRKHLFSGSSTKDSPDAYGLSIDFGTNHSEHPTHKSMRYSPTVSDIDEQELGGDIGFSLSDLGIRTMSFRMSAERGRWKTDPVLTKRPSLLSSRKSVPAIEPLSNNPPTSRLISEPAPSTIATLSTPLPQESENLCNAIVPEVTSASSPVTLPSMPTSPLPESIPALPPLASDRESSMEMDEVLTPSSPLPPSSPPPISPASSLAPLPARSNTPTLSMPSSPLVVPSSPLSPISSDIGEEDVSDIFPLTSSTPEQDAIGVCVWSGATATSNLDSTPRPHDHLACATPELSNCTDTVTPCINRLEVQMTKLEQVEEIPTTSTSLRCAAINPLDESTACNFAEDSQPQPQTGSGRKGRGSQGKIRETSEPSKENDPPNANGISSSDAAPCKKRPKTKIEGGPSRKRMKVSDGGEALSMSSPDIQTKSVKPRRRGLNSSNPEPVTSESIIQELPPVMVESSLSRSPSRASSPVASLPLAARSNIKRDRNGIEDGDAEICGMIIEGMATSRASSLPIPSIYKIVMQNRPSLKEERSEKEWHDVFERVLQSGVVGHGSGVFGKVDSSYKDDNNHSAEARWFYVPEMDCDQERASLIRSMMPRPGKRSVTKQYKQYYYQPLDKISRWDPEDDL